MKQGFGGQDTDIDTQLLFILEMLNQAKNNSPAVKPTKNHQKQNEMQDLDK